MQTKLIQIKDYLLLIDEEVEIQKGDLMHDNHLVGLCNCTKVVNKLPYSYTSSFLNVDKVIAYYPLTKEAKKLDLPLLPLVGLETEEGKIWKEDGVFVYLQNGKKYKKSELELWVENT